MGLADLIQGKSADTAKPDSAPEPLSLGVGEEEQPEAKAAQAKGEPEEIGVEAGDDGKPKSIPYPRFAELNGKKKAAEGRAAQLEAELKAAKEAKPSEYHAFVEEHYGKFEKPIETLREDAQWAAAFWELKNDPTVRAAIVKIQQHHQGAMRVSDRTAKSETPAAPAADPRVDALVREQVRGTGRAILAEAKVREQLHGPILDHVLSQNPNPSREAVLTLVKEYVSAQGWTNQFLRGDGKPAKPAIVPNPGGLAGGTPKKDAKTEPEKPKSLAALQTQNRSRLHELMQQRGL